jgi:hypothetical protein
VDDDEVLWVAESGVPDSYFALALSEINSRQRGKAGRNYRRILRLENLVGRGTGVIDGERRLLGER